MKKQLVHISMLQSAKVAGALYLVISIPFIILFGLATMFTGGIGTFFGSIFMIIIAPIVYAVVGFLFTLVGAFVYNLVAARIGGFEYTSDEIGSGK